MSGPHGTRGRVGPLPYRQGRAWPFRRRPRRKAGDQPCIRCRQLQGVGGDLNGVAGLFHRPSTVEEPLPEGSGSFVFRGHRGGLITHPRGRRSELGAAVAHGRGGDGARRCCTDWTSFHASFHQSRRRHLHIENRTTGQIGDTVTSVTRPCHTDRQTWTAARSRGARAFWPRSPQAHLPEEPSTRDVGGVGAIPTWAATAGAARPGPSCERSGSRWTTQKESRRVPTPPGDVT